VKDQKLKKNIKVKNKDARIFVQHLCAYHNLILANSLETAKRMALPESKAMMMRGVFITLKNIQQSILKICAARGLDRIQTKIIFKEHIQTHLYLTFLAEAQYDDSTPTSPCSDPLHRADATESASANSSGCD
jgi:hypothetical protein